MKNLKKYDINAIVKSIGFEIRNYNYWDRRISDVSDQKGTLDEKMYGISAVAYDRIIKTKGFDDIEHRLILSITDKQEIQNDIDHMMLRKNFVDYFIDLMNENEKDFIQKVLIQRRYYETNTNVAIRVGLTESGVRYKIEKIIHKTFIKFITESEKRRND